ncbi:TetR/AcrR family transcriptional regulator [Myxococcus sp. CA051A]|uniref:TetR/AcrR family transcriptional regulator n=1 Tax=unclassified Myxococcus TaxID=2648731 RepID=UPI00157AB3FC|nr:MULTISPECIES: TetR/AcrR family transcriptional regulator [unclassified Myxococcus]NTX10695.1 TetR/AcrR family transcriptional regulator [Myxococcus sp. CA056]NTX41359.1 TetR/AcrR family transcriptional regulator [Myxococcus sp. CA033]NTX50683.1 TetR/AcrR family transcriptional regulator [Myxococcus sp. CA039A]NTX66030.1 TetR/AcrR family transcriptional regulator [Myxococcus sp. CA051A]
MSTPTRSRLRAQPASLPPSAPSDGTRRRILETALQLFASRGYHDTSIRDLAKVLELQPSALYAHFASKEHVLAELVRIGHEAHHEALQTALKESAPEPRQQVRALVRAHTRTHALHPQLAVVVNEELYALTPELAAPAVALRDKSAALLAEVIERGVAQKSFSPPHPRVTAAAISAMGVRLPYWYEQGGALDVETLSELHAELALRMLGDGAAR